MDRHAVPPIIPYVSMRMSAEGENMLMIKAKLAMILPAIVTRLHPNRLVKALTIGPGQKKHTRLKN